MAMFSDGLFQNFAGALHPVDCGPNLLQLDSNCGTCVVNNRLESELRALKLTESSNSRKLSNQNNNEDDLISTPTPPIVFVTPTAYRATQKADLIRLGQTLAGVPELFWILIEDSATPSPFIDDILARMRIQGVHLTALTPVEKKMNHTDPATKFPRGVEQRNAALQWIRENLSSWHRGVLYFGDDDNTYDWRLFDEMRSIRLAGVWPVGIVGGMLVETPLLHPENFTVRGFNARWKPTRRFPIDMAGFAVNLSLVHEHPDTAFSYKSPRGLLESHFLESLGLTRPQLEPLADKCSRVLVWHTRTEKPNLGGEELKKFLTKSGLTQAEQDALF